MARSRRRGVECGFGDGSHQSRTGRPQYRSGRVDEVVLGMTIPQPGYFFGPPTIAGRIGVPQITGPMIGCGSTTSCGRSAGPSEPAISVRIRAIPPDRDPVELRIRRSTNVALRAERATVPAYLRIDRYWKLVCRPSTVGVASSCGVRVVIRAFSCWGADCHRRGEVVGGARLTISAIAKDSLLV